MKKLSFYLVITFSFLIFNLTFATNYNQEFQDAYKFAYSNGITTAGAIDKANMNGGLTRIAMAKMLSNYAINVLGKEPDISKGTPIFNDVTNKLDNQYGNAVTLAYQLGIMGQNVKNNNFRPYGEVTRAEFGTALSRLLYGDKYNQAGSDYYSKHLNILKNMGIMTRIDNPSQKEIRGYVMIMLMRFYNGNESNSENSGNPIVELDVNNQTGNNNTTTGNLGINVSGPTYDCDTYLDLETRDAYNRAYQWGIVTEPWIIDENIDPVVKNEYLDPRNAYELKLGCGVTNAEFAKMLVIFSKHAGKFPDVSKDCSFSDIDILPTDTASAIIEMCQLGVIGEDVDKFRPNDFITQGEFFTYLSRLLWGNEYDGGVSYLSHRNALRDAGIYTSFLCDLTFPNYGGDCVLKKQQILIMFIKTGDKRFCSEPEIKLVCSDKKLDAYEKCPEVCRVNCNAPLVKLACSDPEAEYYESCPMDCREE